MRCLAALLAISSCALSATVQGVIFDEETLNPIARTHVELVPLPGTSADPVAILADEHGQYVFSGVKTGWYLIRASRIGFETTEFGLLRPGLPGTPLEVTDHFADNELHQIIMRRQAAISGTVVDENGIGIPEWSVSIYTARQPIRRITETKTDDRGNFRVGELERGTYIVRAAGGSLEDDSTLVPSYFKYGTALSGAEPIFVRLGETAAFTVVHTVPGQLFEVRAGVTAPDLRRVAVSLIADTGRRGVGSETGAITINNVAPGETGLLVEGAGCAGHTSVMVDRNMSVGVNCAPLSVPVITGAGSYPVIGRRADLDGPGEEFPLDDRHVLSPGRWEFTVRPSASHYVVSIQNEGDTSPPPAAIDGWFGVDIGNAPRLQVNLSTKPASVTGTVSSASKLIVGAPVFLQLVNPNAPETALQTWRVRADAQGRFIFTSLPPGTYRLVSSYAFDDDDAYARDRSVTIAVKEGETAEQALDLLLQ